MARVQTYGGKPYTRRNAVGAAQAVETFPNLAAAPGTPATGLYAREGKSKAIHVVVSGAAVQMNFDNDFTTHYITLPIGGPYRFEIEAKAVYFKGTAAGSIYEMLAELSHG